MLIPQLLMLSEYRLGDYANTMNKKKRSSKTTNTMLTKKRMKDLLDGKIKLAL